jgi:hypothetical protein
MHTREQIKNALHYNPETGIFTWLISPSQRALKGSVAGTVNDAGYIVIGLDGNHYRAHRLAWFYMTGEWPTIKIDHENTVRSDNRWGNLRLANDSQNVCNQTLRADNTSGVKGVRFWKNKTHEYVIARLAVYGKVIQKNFSVAKLGRDEAFRMACQCIADLREAAHGKFANHARGD